jgi:peptide chain release factor subunit 3
LNIVFIGHVDAGKSTISGQILYITGMVDQRIIEKYEKEAIEKNRSSWFLAYIMDTNEEERAKGKTVEVGRAHFNTEKKRYTILDAPGHKNFVPNMISGVAQADIAVLVVSSRKGEFEAGFERSGQTREHALLAKTLGVKKLIVVINKMDDPTTLWSKERYDSIQEQISKYLRSIGFVANDVCYLPISGYTGQNIKVPVVAEECPWWKGSTLLETLDSLKPLERMDELPLRIPVLDRYKDSGKTVIMGKVETGVLKTGDEILCNPNNIKLIATQIQNDEFIISVAKPGENVKIIVKVSPVEEEFVLKGSVISHPNNPCNATSDIVAQIVILQLLETKKIFTAAYQCVLHIGTAVEEVKVTRLLDQLDKTGKSQKKNPPFVLEKGIVIAHLTTAKPICVEKYEEYAQLGRFTLRDEGKTIGFGKILATNAPVAVKRVKK